MLKHSAFVARVDLQSGVDLDKKDGMGHAKSFEFMIINEHILARTYCMDQPCKQCSNTCLQW